VAATARE
jgi:hypothetical protein